MEMIDEISVIKFVLKEINERMACDDDKNHYGPNGGYYVYQNNVLNDYIRYLDQFDYELCNQLKNLLRLHSKSNEDVIQLITVSQEMSGIISDLTVPCAAMVQLSESAKRPWKIQTRCLLVTNIILSCLCAYLLWFHG